MDKITETHLTLIADMVNEDSFFRSLQGFYLKTPYHRAKTLKGNDDLFYKQIAAFAALIKSDCSPNPFKYLFNFEPGNVLDCGYTRASELKISNWLAPERIGFGIDPKLIAKYKCLLYVSGFVEEFPIILDSEHRVVDGLQRLYAARELGIAVCYLQYDFTNMRIAKANEEPPYTNVQ